MHKKGGDERRRLPARSATSGAAVGTGVFVARDAESFTVLYTVGTTSNLRSDVVSMPVTRERCIAPPAVPVAATRALAFAACVTIGPVFYVL